MKATEELNYLYDLLDETFNSINANNKASGTGMSYQYEMKQELKDDQSVYSLEFKLRELGHGERILQTLSYIKPKELDRYKMECQVIRQALLIFSESTMLHWNELGKMLNSDISMQEAAKKA